MLEELLKAYYCGQISEEILGDYLEEIGEDRDTLNTLLPTTTMFAIRPGSGVGSGIGNGGGIGRGRGRGSGIGGGRGIGGDSGSGIGGDSGSGIGVLKQISTTEGVLLMEIGKAYLIHCGDWHTFVGRVTKKVSTFLYELESVSKIRNTNNGDNWHDLCNGKNRERAEYAHYKTPARVPLSIIAFEWVGKTPQEEGYR